MVHPASSSIQHPLTRGVIDPLLNASFGIVDIVELIDIAAMPLSVEIDAIDANATAQHCS